ncbi:MAG: hypothetical protein MASP_01623 [Candidatus Methanolliviera sp. GoM_asphalt]|nr:MAG: hypothetical protein MASP_01623 [Candidatus Methanolliviera sp. GoM_asphalt]
MRTMDMKATDKGKHPPKTTDEYAKKALKDIIPVKGKLTEAREKNKSYRELLDDATLK